MGVPPLRIEIKMSISGIVFNECYSRRANFQDGDLTIKIIGKDDLKKNKAAAARHKDLSDLEYLP